MNCISVLNFCQDYLPSLVGCQATNLFRVRARCLLFLRHLCVQKRGTREPLGSRTQSKLQLLSRRCCSVTTTLDSNPSYDEPIRPPRLPQSSSEHPKPECVAAEALRREMPSCHLNGPQEVMMALREGPSPKSGTLLLSAAWMQWIAASPVA